MHKPRREGGEYLSIGHLFLQELRYTKPMAVLTLERVSLAFDHIPLLDDVVLQIEPGERLALVGRNGSGKSTLFTLLAGEVQPDTGVISRTRSLRLAHVPQEPVFSPDDTVTQVVTRALGTIGELVAA